MTLLLHSALLTDERGETPDGWVLFDGDRIRAAGSGQAPDADDRVDLEGARLVPGFVDIHGHGGGGHAYDDGGEELDAALATHRALGTTRSVVSLVANPLAALRASLGEIAELMESDPLVLGTHLEGPFLAPAKRGAHHVDYLREPDPITVDELIEAAHGTLRQITLAPELPGADQAIDAFVAAGVKVAVGHTDADFETAARAFDRGASILTHAFNAMNGIHHRAPGPVVAALSDPRVTLELVVDGHHVDERIVALTLDEAPGRVAFITDSMAAAGSADGDYRLGALNVTVRDGRAMLSGTDTIAGSTLTQDAALRRAVDIVGLPWPDAVGAVTAVPARALGFGDRLGLLEPGYAADAVALDDDSRVFAVWAAGERIR
ncbi:N-acetylglucosamine-6-phosphate deacetylase [Protaetiibacter mangrovi]|uniref:N-acetylglucosamine-6-phosphate deacetylase n=1 Tax=Protaetiibacter mangrovi TaxID=2970926 RepID=A0ABT1ZDJ1_9MICO|nr:N-acetylglucosamine-6-phosphate deacetylase [Protaetiibacter mangrovi]MCS0498755.1 N-acetylglucosamine-6-phosphate deacetylase [Protaetiibacter mangrovi]TPX05283.1 N-acetylglucosamine-6-phosphate deacetylase [Schumannella luteola]